MRSTACTNWSRTAPRVGDAARPVHDERRARAAEPRVALPQPQRRVARPRPAPRVVRVGAQAAELVAPREVALDGVGHVLGEAVLVERAERAAFAAGAVVGDQHHQRVVELAERVELRERHDRSARRCARGTRRTPPAGAPACAARRATATPTRRSSSGARRARCPSGTTPVASCAREHVGPPLLPAAVERAAVRLDPLGRDVVRSVHRAEREVEEERTVGRGLVLRGDGADRLVGEVLGEVVAVAAARAVARRSGCRARGAAPSGWCRPGGSRSSARSRTRAASGRTGPRPNARRRGRGATCRWRACCSPRRAARAAAASPSAGSGRCSRGTPSAGR